MLGDDYGQLAGGKEKGLIAEYAGYPGQRNRTPVPTKLREDLTFCDAVGLPCHGYLSNERR
jgi:hypothetical protein